jgi:hypothetical protein
MEAFFRTKELFIKYLEGSATAEETEELSRKVESGPKDEILDILTALMKETAPDQAFEQGNWEPVILEILTGNRESTPPPVKTLHRSFPGKFVAVAASVILLLSFGLMLFKNKEQSSPAKSARASTPKMDVMPGRNQAMLTMANGKDFLLDSALVGPLVTQGSARVLKVNNGQLAYNKETNAGKPAAPVYNTVSTPRGGQYQIVLPDGTHVWLNAASSLRFPTIFSGKHREVELTGEGYFEVAENKSLPFVVAVGEMKVNVLGTHFNIMAYPEEGSIKTTLLEGAVRVNHGTDNVVIKPGEQALLNREEKISVLKKADVEEAVAWKNGNFYFNGSGIQTIMRQVSRWYDLDVEYAGKIPEGHYNGKPSRSLTLMQMLKLVEYSGVKFRVEGKKIIVLN